MSDGPRVGGGKVPLVLELLAPNGRAVQVTTDLAGFWERHYPAIRKELDAKVPAALVARGPDGDHAADAAAQGVRPRPGPLWARLVGGLRP